MGFLTIQSEFRQLAGSGASADGTGPAGLESHSARPQVKRPARATTKECVGARRFRSSLRGPGREPSTRQTACKTMAYTIRCGFPVVDSAKAPDRLIIGEKVRDSGRFDVSRGSVSITSVRIDHPGAPVVASGAGWVAFNPGRLGGPRSQTLSSAVEVSPCCCAWRAVPVSHHRALHQISIDGAVGLREPSGRDASGVRGTRLAQVPRPKRPPCTAGTRNEEKAQ